MSDFDSIVLIAFGGPEKPGNISPFLEIVTAGRRISPSASRRLRTITS